jgi:hypothetical protein
LWRRASLPERRARRTVRQGWQPALTRTAWCGARLYSKGKNQMLKLHLEPMTETERTALTRNGWQAVNAHTAIRRYDASGRTIKAAIDSSGAFTVYWLPCCTTIATGRETTIIMAAMEANEIAWHVQDGATTAEAQTVTTRAAWRAAKMRQLRARGQVA